jgi:uncharacterized protein YlbG (UPF0298 family)
MTQKNPDEIMKEYAELALRRDEIDYELDILKPKIMAYLDAQGIDTLVQNYGTYSIVKRVRWEYSPELNQKDTEYKVAIAERKQEEQERDATVLGSSI